MFERYWELKLFLENESVSNYTILTYYDQVVVEIQEFENQVSGKYLVTIHKWKQKHNYFEKLGVNTKKIWEEWQITAPLIVASKWPKTDVT